MKNPNYLGTAIRDFHEGKHKFLFLSQPKIVLTYKERVRGEIIN